MLTFTNQLLQFEKLCNGESDVDTYIPPVAHHINCFIVLPNQFPICTWFKLSVLPTIRLLSCQFFNKFCLINKGGAFVETVNDLQSDIRLVKAIFKMKIQ